MKRFSIVVMLLTVAVAALAADFWAAKPYTQWSKAEMERIRTTSPWAQTVVLRTANMVQIRRQTGKFASGAGEGEGTVNPEVSYAISLRTARPIREAVVREAALEQKYEQMDATAKAQFDQKWNAFLAQPTPDKIIFHVKYASNTTEVDRQLAAYWQVQTLETLLSDTYMNGPDGERVAPIAFWAGKGGSREFQLAFPRPKEAPKKASFSVEFRHPDVTQQPSTRITARFNVKDLDYKGEITY
jgi:hypothetical protein